MLFNKNQNGAAELKELLGFLYASNNFANIKTDIMLAEEDMAELIGQPIMVVAQNHYWSDLFGTGDNPQEDPNPEDPDPEEPQPDENPQPSIKQRDELVAHIQLPVAYYAYAAFAAHTDVSHGEDGRKVTIDKENQSIAWDWMIDRDDEATFNKAHKTTDRLIAFLEKNADVFPAWKTSGERKAANGLFISSAKIFNSIFPIDNSRRFFMKIIPFIQEAERKHILPVLGKTKYDEIKAELEAGTQSNALLPLIRVPLAYYSLSLAVQRLSVNLLPNGIFQDYISSNTGNRQGRNPAPTDVRKNIIKLIYDDATFELQNLQKELAKIQAAADAVDYEPVSPLAHIKTDTKIFRV